VKQRLKTEFIGARSLKHRTGDNPVDDVMQALPKAKPAVKHHAALPCTKVPQFVQ
jgi:hypothetical protein